MGNVSRKIATKTKRKYEKTYRSTNKRSKYFRKKHGRSRKRNMKIVGGLPEGWKKLSKGDGTPYYENIKTRDETYFNPDWFKAENGWIIVDDKKKIYYNINTGKRATWAEIEKTKNAEKKAEIEETFVNKALPPTINEDVLHSNIKKISELNLEKFENIILKDSDKLVKFINARLNALDEDDKTLINFNKEKNTINEEPTIKYTGNILLKKYLYIKFEIDEKKILNDVKTKCFRESLRELFTENVEEKPTINILIQIVNKNYLKCKKENRYLLETLITKTELDKILNIFKNFDIEIDENKIIDTTTFPETFLDEEIKKILNKIIECPGA